MHHQPKKRFGQNFIKDTNLLRKMVDASNIKGLNVLEIGPGLGALTQFLTLDAKKYLAYEIDHSLKPELKKYESPTSHIKFIDFLEDEDINQTLNEYFEKEELHLVGNLPYYITTPIIFKFLSIDQIKTATIMVQKEVGERMISSLNTKAYNGFAAILQFYTNVTKVMVVNKKIFYPAPKVDSMVVRLEKRPSKLSVEQTSLYESIVKMSFGHKRKTLLNNLVDKTNEPKETILKFLVSQGFDDKVRAENLSVDDFIRLTLNWPLIKK